MTKRHTYKFIAQVMNQCRDALVRMDEQRERLSKEGRPTPTDYTVKEGLLYDIFYTHESIMEQLMDEGRRLRREVKELKPGVDKKGA